jgi:sugar phosphate permease
MVGQSNSQGITGSVPAHIIKQQACSQRRFGALLAFSLLGVINGYAWLMFAPVETTVLAAYRPYFSREQTALLSTWQPLIYVLLSFPMTRLLLRPNGLAKAMRLGIAAEMVGVACKLLSITSMNGTWCGQLLLHGGQILSAVNSPVCIGGPSQLSAEWFRPAERTRATACGVLANNVGNALVYLSVPALVSLFSHGGGGATAKSHESAVAGITAVIAVEFVLAAATFVAVYRTMPIYPREEFEQGDLRPTRTKGPFAHAASAATLVKAVHDYDDDSDLADLSPGTRALVRSGQLQSSASDPSIMSPCGDACAAAELSMSIIASDGPSMTEQLKYFAGSANSLALFAIYAWTSGAFIAWTALFDHLLQALRLPFSDEFIGGLSFASTLAYILGGFISSYLADHYFPTAMKRIILVCCIANTGITWLYSRSLPVEKAHLAIATAEEAIALSAAFEIRKHGDEGRVAWVLREDDSRNTRLSEPDAAGVAELKYADIVMKYTGVNVTAIQERDAAKGRRCRDTVDHKDSKAVACDSSSFKALDLQRAKHGGKSTLPAGSWHVMSTGVLPIGHRFVWFPAKDSTADNFERYQTMRRKTFKQARADAIAADEALTSALPSPLRLQILSFIGGLFNGASAPLFYELIAELTYPYVGEAVSGNIMSTGENLGALVMFQGVAAVIPDSQVNRCFVAGMLVCSILAFFVREDYARRRAFETLAKHHKYHGRDRNLQSSQAGERSALLVHGPDGATSSTTVVPIAPDDNAEDDDGNAASSKPAGESLLREERGRQADADGDVAEPQHTREQTRQQQTQQKNRRRGGKDGANKAGLRPVESYGATE